MALPKSTFTFLARMANSLATAFGRDCEVVVHDLTVDDLESTIVCIENGHVTGRAIGDGLPEGILADIRDPERDIDDQMAYFSHTDDGRVIKATCIVMRNRAGEPIAILAINYDITVLSAMENALSGLVELASEQAQPGSRPDRSQTVGGLLDSLIAQSEELVGKPVALMTKQDKIRALGFLDAHGTFLITKSGQRVCEHFGISKYTLYSYLDEAKRTDGGMQPV